MPTPALYTLIALLALVALLGPAPAAAYEWPGKKAELTRALRSDRARDREAALRDLARFPLAEVRELLLGALQDPAASVRAAAIQTLAQMGAVEERRHLLPFLSDTEPALRAAAATALGELGHPDALDPLLRALGDPEPEVRVAALDALDRLDLPRAHGAIAALLSDRDRRVSSKAIAVLARAGSPQAVFPLLEKLKDPVLRTQLDAIEALGLLGDARATLPLLGLLYDHQPEVRVAVVEALGALRDPRALPDLTRLALSEHQTDLGGRAIQALGALGDPAAVAPLLQLMRHSPAAGAAAEALKALGPEAVAPVLRALQQSEDRAELRLCLSVLQALCFDPRLEASRRPEIARALLAALARLPEERDELLLALLATRAPEALPALLGELQRATPESRQRPAWRQLLGGLGAFEDARVARPLLRLYPQLDAQERKLALEALGRAPAPEALPALREALERGDPEAQLLAARALGRLDLPEASDALLGALGGGKPHLLTEAAAGLGGHSAPTIQPRLLALLPRRGPTRLAALLALGDLVREDPQPETLQALWALALDPREDPQAATAALDALGATAAPQDPRALLDRYAAAPIALRTKILQVLGEWRVEAAAGLLREALRDPAPALRAEAAWGLGLLGDVADAPALLALLQEEAWPVSVNAAGALARLQAPAARAPMLQAVGSTRGATRANLLLGLHRLGEAPDARALLSLARRDPDPLVRDAAALILAQRQERDALAKLAPGAPDAAEVGSGATWKRYLLTDEAARPSIGERALITGGDGLTLGRASDLNGAIRVEHLPPGPTRLRALDQTYVTLD
jgi:HEAT repeat protein